MEKISYKEFLKKLSGVELLIGYKDWYQNENGVLVLEGQVRSQTQKLNPYIKKGACWGGVIGKGKDLDELAQNIFEQLTNNIILLGSYSKFTKKLEFAGKFITKNLSQDELMEYNSDY